MSSLPEFYYTPERYLEMERQADSKSEYLFGEIHAMAGASPEHVAITDNLAGALHSQLRGGSCRVYSSDLRIKTPGMDFYAYPDVAVVCGGLKRDERDASTIINPKVLIEVLSPSTEAYDRGDKFAYYRQVPDLTDYLLVSQDKYRVEYFSKQANGEWLFKVVDTPGESLNIPSIHCSLALADIYESIEAAGEAGNP